MKEDTVNATATATHHDLDTVLCTFTLAGQLCAVPVSHIQEVLRYHTMTPVPTAHSAVSGLINLRGQIVTAIDLRTRLDLPPAAQGSVPMNIVCHSAGETISLLVDDIGDVISIDPTLRQPAPANLPAALGAATSHTLTTSEGIVLVLDIDTLATLPVN